MADTLALDVLTNISWVFQDALDHTTIDDNSELRNKVSLSDGTGSGAVDKIWHDQRTLAASGTETLDLSALTTTIYGSTVTFNLAKVKLLYVFNTATAADEELVVGNAAANAFEAPFAAVSGGKVEVGPNSPLLLSDLTDGWTVGSDVNLKIENTGAASITYNIAIAGTSS